MNILTILSIISLMICFYIGFHVLSLDIRSKVNRLFFLLSLSMCLWALCSIFISSAKDKETLLIWFKIATFAFIPYFALTLHFFLEITKVIKLKSYFYLLIYLPTLILIYGNLTSSLIYKDFIKENNFWIFILEDVSPWMLFYAIYLNLYLLISGILIFLWNKKSKTYKHKRQSFIILIIFIIVSVIGVLEGFFLPAFTKYQSRGLPPIILLFWMIGIWYSMIKYKFLSMTPELVSKYIIGSINESIILLDSSLKIITVNNKTKQLLDIKENHLINNDISLIIHESKELKDEIKKLFQGEYSDFSCRVNFQNHDNRKILMDIKTSIIKDKFNDVIGILIIGYEVKEIKQLKTLYQITDREVNVIQHIITGSTNKEIAEDLGIVERTIKAHLTNIYNKLGVDNRMQLLHLLKDFNLIPDKNAEKTLLFFNK